MIDLVLDRDNLRAAWEDVQANRGAPGSDAVTLKRWGRNWEGNLDRLAQQVRSNTYHPNRPRRFKVLKKDGTFRELSILTVTDRVLQRAVLNVIDDRFERRFLNCRLRLSAQTIGGECGYGGGAPARARPRVGAGCGH